MFPHGSFFRRRRVAGQVLLGGSWLGLALTSCLYDPNDRCDKNQRFDSATGVCACADNTVPGAHGCDPCGEHEIAQGDACGCENGYARPAAGGACALIPQGLGGDCDPAAASCASAYPTCHALTAGGGYCTTSGCATSDDCTGGYACDTSTSPSYCKRPPTGVGASCTSSADCASYDATYCEAFQSHTCQVQGCSTSPDDCFTGSECCDLSSVGFPHLCVPTGKCPVPSSQP